ncbi:hypothetical protein H2201_008206 [Coniosporium apollinis]|uniref:holo-[acyl-carrier-protein] synthase n=2 Tax=Coniosporium TaxID=2810619 RepID=A0ABQ9NL50_9PEZI|nr:hypothetical protein H2199_002892 [Cladosporium sp. JES 115]KAJ9657410.1 hypothetical protein H2201_008206 [Coniosporium apollinis]
MPHSAPELTCWLLDTRTLWPGDKISDAVSPSPYALQSQWLTEYKKQASTALPLISEAEQHNVRNKYHVSDARMTLGSALLKRYYIAHTLGVPWSDISFTRRGDVRHGKPCYLSTASTNSSAGSRKRVDFNVSHQAGLVALIGACWSVDEDEAGKEGEEASPEVAVGIDITCVNERNDYAKIDAEGFDGWMDTYAEFFSEDEIWDMKYTLPQPLTLLDGSTVSEEELGRLDRCVTRDKEVAVTLRNGETRTFSSDLIVDAKLRRFYTFWGYKEAFIKLTGEAMMAPWLRDLEFRNVKAPKQGTVPRCSTHGVWGERVSDAEVYVHDERVEDVSVEIQAFEEDFMIAVAVRPQERLGESGIPKLERVDVEDILAAAESGGV